MKKFLAVIILILTGIGVFSQKTYLIDTQGFYLLPAEKKDFLNRQISFFHRAKEDTTKCIILEQIIDSLQDNQLNFRYNKFLARFAADKLKKISRNSDEYDFYRQVKAFTDFYKGEEFLYNFYDYDSAKFYYEKSAGVFEQNEEFTRTGDCYAQLGFLEYYFNSDLPKAIILYEKSLDFYKRAKDTANISFALSSLGFLHDQIGDVANAIKYYDEALKIAQEKKLYKRIGILLNNIGTIYYDQYSNDSSLNSVKEALNFFRQALYYYKIAKYERAMPQLMINLGVLYDERGQADSALFFYRQAFKEAQKFNDLKIQALALHNLGAFFHQQKQFDSALFYFNKALEIARKNDLKQEIVNTLVNLANLYTDQKRYEKGVKILDQALELANQINDIRDKINIFEAYNKIYSQQKNYKLAYYYLTKFYNLRDSVINAQTKEAIINQKLRFEYEKQKLLEEAEYRKKIDLLQESRKRSRLVSWFAAVIALLVLILLIIVYNRFKTLRQKNRIIERQKTELLEIQKQLTLRNKKLTDSINYAKRIQEAFLKQGSNLNSFFKDSFVLYLPKDIVSGDFYWTKKIGNYIYVAVGDCTGHGVPGAILSVLAVSYLNEIFAKEQPLEPAEALEFMRKRFLSDFNFSETDHQYDSIDMILLKIDTQNNTLYWSSANRPLWMIASEGHILKFKAFRQSIGFNFRTKEFENYRTPIDTDTIVYLFTDGYYDQFNYTLFEKLTMQRFEKFLSEIYIQSLIEQKRLLEERWRKWKGSANQTDDILVLGIKF